MTKEEPSLSPNATALQSISLSTPSDLLTLLFSLSALHEWLKLIIIGGFIETCRRLFSEVYRRLDDAFFITATFEEEDESFEWVMHWLSKHPSWAKARNIRITTRTFGLDGQAVMVPGEEIDVQSIAANKRRLAYLPSVSSSTTLWYKCHWVRATRMEVEGPSMYRRREELLEIRILSRTHDILNQLLLEAKREYLAAQEDTISVLVSDSSNNWRHLASRPKRSLNSIILDPGVKDELLADAKDFLASKPWYASRGIPFRRGYLLHGAPGSGKTSLIHSLAGELGLDIYVISLSRAGLDDTGLMELISFLPGRCIALMEDIDAALTQSINRDSNIDEASGDGKELSASDQADKQPSPVITNSLSRVSLSGLLNALDGIAAQEGRIFFATTNKYSSLDPALCRPGRMDVHIEFKLASKFQARELYKAFYMLESEEKGSELEKDRVDSGKEEKTAGGAIDLIDLSGSSDDDKANRNQQTNDGVAITGLLRQHETPVLSRQAVITMADAFAEAIPEREVSMASLQGYLMMYKTRPEEAVTNARLWAEKERSGRKK